MRYILVVLLGLAFHLSRMSLISQAFAPDSIFGMDSQREFSKRASRSNPFNVGTCENPEATAQ